MTDIFNNPRKRSRSSEEEDFLPLSKKINNLHINPWTSQLQADRDPSHSWDPKFMAPTQPQVQAPQAWPPPYAPDLSPEENPFYYENNKLLFDLYLARANRNGKPMLRQGDTGDWVGTFQGHKGAVWGVALNPAATHAATGAADFQAKVWDAISGEVLHSFQHQHIVKSVAFSADSALLATGSNERLVRLYDLNRPDAEPVVFTGHTAGIKDVGFLRGQSHVVSCADDRTLRVWDRSTGSEVQKVDLASVPNSLEVSRDGSTLTVAHGSTVSFYDAFSLVNLRDITIPTKVNSASLHPDKNMFVCGGEDLKMYKFDYASGNEIESFRGHFGPVHCVRFSPDGELYASGSEDGTLRLWQTTVGKTYGLWKCVDAADPVIIPKTEVTTN